MRTLATLLTGTALSLAALNADAKTLATVNGQPIDSDQVEKHLNQIPPALLQSREEEVKKSILDKLVEQEILRQQAQKMDITSNDEFQEQLEQLKQNLTYNFMLKKKLDDQLTEERLRAEYEKVKDQFAQPRAKARHILLEDKAAAEKVISQLNDGGDFKELAQSESIGPSGPRGGDLGWFGPADMVPSFSETAFSLEPGEYTKKPVQTQFGWHVILLEDKEDASAPAFEEVEEQLRRSIGEKVINAYLEELKDDANIVYMEE